MLKGDLNALQQEALQWLLIDEAENESDRLETILRFMTITGSNPQLYRTIWPDEDNPDVDWMTPQSQEEIDTILAQLQEVDARSESSLAESGEGAS